MSYIFRKLTDWGNRISNKIESNIEEHSCIVDWCPKYFNFFFLALFYTLSVWVTYAVFFIIFDYERRYKPDWCYWPLWFYGMYLFINIQWHYHKARTLKPNEETGVPRDPVCTKCHRYRSIATHHCSSCKRCVAGYDHHCPWLLNCVGAHNHRHFIMLLIQFLVAAVSIVGFSWRTFRDNLGHLVILLNTKNYQDQKRFNHFNHFPRHPMKMAFDYFFGGSVSIPVPKNLIEYFKEHEQLPFCRPEVDLHFKEIICNEPVFTGMLLAILLAAYLLMSAFILLISVFLASNINMVGNNVAYLETMKPGYKRLTWRVWARNIWLFLGFGQIPWYKIIFPSTLPPLKYDRNGVRVFVLKSEKMLV